MVIAIIFANVSDYKAFFPAKKEEFFGLTARCAADIF
jgi:hypothetical protein